MLLANAFIITFFFYHSVTKAYVLRELLEQLLRSFLRLSGTLIQVPTSYQEIER